MMSFNIPANETPEQAQQRMHAAQMQMQAVQQMPTDMGSGIQSVANALMARERQKSSAFPTAPGGAQPSFMTRIGNMFGLGGGLY